MLLLETFQAGLSWECVLNKREAFRNAFDGFDPVKIAAYEEAKLEALLQDPGIIRNRLKIRAAVTNARIFLELAGKWGRFDRYLWHFTAGKTLQEHHGRTHSDLSDNLSRAWKKLGMKFVGTTVVYSYLQAVGVVDSHEPGCFKYQGV